MTFLRVTLAALGVMLALVAASCGGSTSVPEGAVAVVDGTEIPRSELDELVEIAKKGAEAQKQEFPKVGTPEYQSLQTQWVAILVQREEFRQEAEELGIEVTKKDVDQAIADLVEERFDSDRKEFEKAVAQQGYSMEAVRKTIEASVVAQKLFEEVTKESEVSEEEILAYYTQNQSQYGTPESREVRHILVSEKTADGKIDYAKSKAEADRIYAELQAGADFAALAKEESDDPGTASSGGKYTAIRGQSVAAFDKVSFELKTGEISQPVKTEFGYHVVEATSNLKKASVTKLDQVRASIRQLLLQERRNAVMREWLDDLRDRYEGKVGYAEGFHPPEVPDAPTETTETE